jgi:hypothetical protein
MTIARTTDEHGRSGLLVVIAVAAGRGLRFVAWRFLGLFSGLVGVIFGAAALITVLMAFVWELSGVAPHFSFWRMIGFAGGCLALIVAYHAVLELLRPRRRD